MDDALSILDQVKPEPRTAPENPHPWQQRVAAQQLWKA
jgi:hypothetical protein